MSVNTNAGTMFFIGLRLLADLPKDAEAALAVLTASTYVEIGEIENIGDYGDEIGDVNFSGVRDGRTRHLKGLADAGSMDLTIGFDKSDVGQIKLVAAQKDRSRFDYPIKIVYLDGVTDYFAGKVMSVKKQPGGAEDIVKRSTSIGINSEIYETETPVTP